MLSYTHHLERLEEARTCPIGWIAGSQQAQVVKSPCMHLQRPDRVPHGVGRLLAEGGDPDVAQRLAAVGPAAAAAALAQLRGDRLVLDRLPSQREVSPAAAPCRLHRQRDLRERYR